MENTKVQITSLQVAYLTIITALFLVIIIVPAFVAGPVQLKNPIPEKETIEVTLTGILFILSIFIIRFYKREMANKEKQIQGIKNEKEKVEERLLESDQYIGLVNVRIQDIKSIFYSFENYPKTKTELKNTFVFLGKRILRITNSNWALIRIIDRSTQKTISEHFESKGDLTSGFPHVSNKTILEEKQFGSNISVICNPKNLDILVSCTLSVDKISSNERIFVQAIANEIAKQFIITNSSYNRVANKVIVNHLPNEIGNRIKRISYQNLL
jgi:hypothetical protein